ncbi:DUF3540 domain-containing protein [Desulfonatronum thioautotrophicum]|uniref:DUF3540 domain-containing protein n=1 Tax=Desulfonatronum thioautotrophicum TaxID=617001 RepID=UPI0005EB1C05|nr:DUF3540 domain-containing protein [Desulfonatronum thioautotrophicum]
MNATRTNGAQRAVIAFPLPGPAHCADSIPNPEQGRIVHGRVVSGERGRFIIRLESGRVLESGVATGCLVAPGLGDMVLVYDGPGKVVYILSVLESGREEIRLETKENLVVRAPKVRFEGGESLKVSAPEVTINGGSGRLDFLRLGVLAASLEARIGRFGSIVDAVRVTARSMVQTLGHCLRRVEGVETNHAGHLRIQVEKSCKLKAGSADLRAKGTMAVDGKRVNIG